MLKLDIFIPSIFGFTSAHLSVCADQWLGRTSLVGAQVGIGTDIHRKGQVLCTTTRTMLAWIQGRKRIISIARAIPSPIDVQITIALHTIADKGMPLVVDGGATHVNR